MPLAKFRIYSREDFIFYILQTNFSRTVKIIQNHHTWKPRKEYLTPARDEMYWLESMRSTHIHERGWKDIGQHITTFPSGNIGLCRPIDLTPAGIYGANSGAICIEHFGNFDDRGDEMSQLHRESIVDLNAILCVKFGLRPTASQVVYHHWYDTEGRRFSDSDINSGKVLTKKLQKTCPGTNFFHDPADNFKGNTILSAQKNFYPLISAAIAQVVVPRPQQAGVQMIANAFILNVRSGKGVSFPVISQLKKGALVNVYETSDNWSRINVNSEQWVSSQYLV